MEQRRSTDDLKALLLKSDPELERALLERTQAAADFQDLWVLSRVRRKAEASGMLWTTPHTTLRTAMIGMGTLHPLHELVEHAAWGVGYRLELFVGAHDNYRAEIVDPGSGLYRHGPRLVLIFPDPALLRAAGAWSDPAETTRHRAEEVARELLSACRLVHERTGAAIVLANFPPAPFHDPGPLRTTCLASPWAFTKLVNLALGQSLPDTVHLLDVEFLACRFGIAKVQDERAWFEGGQHYSPDFQVVLAKEVGQLLTALHHPPKKVLVTDLDGTLWGGVIGDDGVAGIELGTVSPRGHAYQTLQRYLQELRGRGILLAVCSKNEEGVAREPFERHPETVLRLEDFVAFKANWAPKPDNLRHIAAELNLGLDSVVFLDDNPAEIELVRREIPEVVALQLEDPALAVRMLAEARLFEPRRLTDEDFQRTEMYRQERQRQACAGQCTDLAGFLQSLGMTARYEPFTALNLGRIAQLVQRSNQFNLTTKRRDEAQLRTLMADQAFLCRTLSLADRFGDYGLICVLIAKVRAADSALFLDTWLMSCRVLSRQVEELALNLLVEEARNRSLTTLQGLFLPTRRNDLVREHYDRLGFLVLEASAEVRRYRLEIESFCPRPTPITVVRY